MNTFRKTKLYSFNFSAEHFVKAEANELMGSMLKYKAKLNRPNHTLDCRVLHNHEIFKNAKQFTIPSPLGDNITETYIYMDIPCFKRTKRDDKVEVDMSKPKKSNNENKENMPDLEKMNISELGLPRQNEEIW